jgi:hypothetical protein
VDLGGAPRDISQDSESISWPESSDKEQSSDDMLTVSVFGRTFSPGHGDVMHTILDGTRSARAFSAQGQGSVTHTQ